MKNELTLALALAYATTGAAATLEPVELHKCQGRDQFTYWSTPPCAPGDRAIAIASPDPRKTLAEQIRTAECKVQALRQLTKDKRPDFTTSARGPDTSHCQ
jgi:hypothetical protein